MLSPFHTALIYLVLGNVFAGSNFFFGDDDIINDPFLDANYQDFSLDETPSFDDSQANMFATLPDEDLLWDDNNNSLSSCVINENAQTMLQARDKSICPQQNTPPTTFTTPSLPDFTDIENALEKKPARSSSSSSGGPEKNRPTGPYLPLVLTHSDHRVLYGNEPEYYCNLYVMSLRRPTPYVLPVPPTIPVCGSGRASDRYGKFSLGYRGLYNGRLRKLLAIFIAIFCS